MSSKNELACIYASLILIDDDVAVTGEKVQTLLKAANLEVEPYWPGLFAKALESIGNPKDLLTKIGSGVGTAGPAGGAGAAAAAAPAAETKAEEKKKEEEEEVSDDDMGFGLFD